MIYGKTALCEIEKIRKKKTQMCIHEKYNMCICTNWTFMLLLLIIILLSDYFIITILSDDNKTKSNFI